MYEDFACKTFIIVTHQLSKSVKIDKIHKLEKGEIIPGYPECDSDLPLINGNGAIK